MSYLGLFWFLLAEGEGMIMSWTTSLTLTMKGEYSLIANLCGMVCRFLFLPIEEMSFNVLSRDKNIKYLTYMLWFLLLLGLYLVVMSNLYSYQALFLLYRTQWANDSTVLILKLYTVYVLGMGVNGQLEAYLLATQKAKNM